MWIRDSFRLPLLIVPLFFVRLVWRQYSVGRFRALRVVVRQPFSNPCASLRASFKCVEVDAFIFDGPPEPSDHPVVNPSALAIQGYFHASIFQCLCPLKAGNLTPVIAVHDFGLAIFGNHLFLSFDPKIGFHAIGQAPRQNLAAVPIH